MSKLTNLQSYISYRILEMRVNKQWTQQQVADKLKTSRSQVCRLENPTQCKTSIETLVKIAKIHKKDLQIEFVNRD